MPKVVIKEDTQTDQSTDFNETEILDLMAEESAQAMESELSELFKYIENEINMAFQDANKNQ
jgi:hypothetical protein